MIEWVTLFVMASFLVAMALRAKKTVKAVAEKKEESDKDLNELLNKHLNQLE